MGLRSGSRWGLDTLRYFDPVLRNCPRGSSASSGQSERWTVPSCLVTDSPMLFVVLQLKDAPDIGLGGLGEYLWYRGLGPLLPHTVSAQR